MSPRLRDSLSALNYFALVCLSALSISFIVSIIVETSYSALRSPAPPAPTQDSEHDHG